MSDNLPFSEDINYWMTSQSSSDSWMDKTKKLIESFGGQISMEVFGNEPNSGRSAYMLAFTIGGDHFKIVWPVLPTRKGNQKAARVQATTFIYHDVKAKIMAAEVLGARAAFFSYLQLPDGRNVSEASIQELSLGLPDLFKISKPQLDAGTQVIDGEIIE